MEAQFAFLCEGVTPEGGAADDRLTDRGLHDHDRTGHRAEPGDPDDDPCHRAHILG